MNFDLNSTELNWAHPVVREWFLTKFGSPTEPQAQGWPHIVSGRTTLISAPTGSGKTLAAFLACIERLVRKSVTGELKDETQVLYVSPLRALSNDIQKNLQAPLSEILMLAWKLGYMMSEIRTAVRTGDTLPRERQAMLRRPPHILVTTPESLYILLTAEKSRAVLKHVETVIVDEIHAVADDKRGAHLSLSLERLEQLALKKPIRIGLSATQKPIEEVAHFLCGTGRPDPVIVDVGHKRQVDLAVEVPPSELAPVASHELWNEIHERLAQLINQHRSTLIFVNTRKLAERTAHRLIKILGEDAVTSHHGSLSRKLRLAAEKKLKNGELKALVATASLELGIDIGAIDLVCQIGSPRAIAIGLQRVGRSGHWRGAIPKGRFFPTTRDELIECAALIHAIRSGDLDRLMIPEMPLDILSQQIAASCSAEEWDEERLFQMMKSAYPYRNLTREQFNSVLEMLCDGISSTKGRYGSHLHRDRVQGVIRPRRGTRMISIMSGGAIPETGLFTVVAQPDENVVGTLDEDFAVESNQGDIILLGTTSWMIRRVQSSQARVIVEDAHGAPPTVPFWRGEAPARTQELSHYVSFLRTEMNRILPPSTPLEPDKSQHDVSIAMQWLMNECGADQSGADQIIRYILEGRAVLGTVPSQKTVIAERFFDEAGGMQLVIHAPFGARINKAWGLALRKRFCRSFNLELQASATDDGINISLTEQHSFPLADVFKFLHSNSVENVLTQAAFASPLFGTRWRWNSMRSLALMRFYRGKKVPLNILRMRAEDLLASVFPEAAACQDNIVGEIHPPDHP
ncbi:MAG TPA: DEAD/DEAH box helicase, partial [Acidobacteriota bacterium]|nr:DEAD/DEAH box helicase [Acidobacteriota bacterium]